MATRISSAAKSAALGLVRDVPEEERPAIFYVDRIVTSEWQGFAGQVEVVTHNYRSDEDSIAVQFLARDCECYALIDAATGSIDLVNEESSDDDSK